MTVDYCIYCGSDSLSYLHEKQLVKHNCDIIHCQKCKLKFSDLERRLEADDRLLNTKPDFPIGDEDDTLASALKLMREKKWSEALFWLCRHHYPLTRVSEFVIYRGICQAAAALDGSIPLSMENNYDAEAACRLLSEALIDNIQRLSSCLPQSDEEKRFAALQSIFNAVMVFPYTSVSEEIIASTLRSRQLTPELEERQLKNRQQLQVLIAFADYLESLRDTAHDLEYCKMARAVYTACRGDAARLSGIAGRSSAGSALVSAANGLVRAASAELTHTTLPGEKDPDAEYPYDIDQILKNKLYRLEKIISCQDPADISQSDIREILHRQVSLKTVVKSVFAAITAAAVFVVLFFREQPLEQLALLFGFADKQNLMDIFAANVDEIILATAFSAAAGWALIRNRSRVKKLYSEVIETKDAKKENRLIYKTLADNLFNIAAAAAIIIYIIFKLIN